MNIERFQEELRKKTGNPKLRVLFAAGSGGFSVERSDDIFIYDDFQTQDVGRLCKELQSIKRKPLDLAMGMNFKL